ALGNDDVDGPRQAVGNAEVALGGIADEACELHREGVVQPELLTQFFTLLLGRLLPDHVVDRIADEIEQAEGHQRDDEHHDDGLENPPNDEGQHDSYPAALIAGQGPGGSTLTNVPPSDRIRSIASLPQFALLPQSRVTSAK